jgi:hypothetical protein
MMTNFFQAIPLWGIFIFTFFIALLSFEGGVLLGKKHRPVSAQEDRSPIGSIVSATLALLAFLLAFTFNLSTSKFDNRRELVIEEANAIGTTYLRAGYLAEPYQTEIRSLLREYVATRLAALQPGRLEQAIKRSDELQDKIWLNAIAVAEKNPNSIVTGLFIQSLNELIDLHAKRVNVVLYVRIPMLIWGALYFILILALGSLGYQVGISHARYMGITFLLILTFSSVILLIVDLDRPQEGFIQVSQQSLMDLLDKFNQSKN